MAQQGMVEVRPLPLKKWHGKKGKESFTQPKVIEVLYNTNTGKYSTGLTEEEAKLYGSKLGVDLSDTFNVEQPHPYWGSKAAAIKLPDHTVFFNKSIASEYVKIANMKASRKVANSLKDWEDGLYPEATHYIHDEDAEIAVKATKIQLQRKVDSFLIKMTKDDKINIIQILSNKSVKGRSDEYIDVILDEIVKDDPKEFLRFVQMGKEEIYVRAAVLEAIAKQILNKEGNQIYYMGDLIALDYEDAVKWFKNQENSKMKVAILEKLNK